MTVSITCYGGVREIGGNKILLEDGQTRLFLDFGTPFARQELFFNEYLRPRTARGLLDVMCLELVPPLEGLYSRDLAPPGVWERFRGTALYRNLQRQDAPVLDAVLTSHAHLDHNGDQSYLDPDIPICATRTTAFIARAMQTTGQSGFERELAWVTPRWWDERDAVLRSERHAPYRARTYAFLDGPLTSEAQKWWESSPGAKPIQTAGLTSLGKCLRNVELRWWPVDHSVPGAVAFAVHTSGGWVGYTGDIRFHGKDGPAMERLSEELAALQPVALLCEGTHLAEEAPISEEQVADNALRLVHQAQGRLVVADFAPRNVERLLTFLQVAQATQRRLAIQPNDAYLLHAMALATPGSFQDPLLLPAVVLYADPKSAPRSWEKELRQAWSRRTVSATEVCAHPGDYILCFSLWDANDLLDLEGIAGGVYLYSNSRAYDEEQAVDLQRLRNWVQHVGLRLEGDPDDPHRVPLHASGHATGPQLRDFVRRVRPRHMIPIHTQQPEWWMDALPGSEVQVVLPEMGVPIVLG